MYCIAVGRVSNKKKKKVRMKNLEQQMLNTNSPTSLVLKVFFATLVIAVKRVGDSEEFSFFLFFLGEIEPFQSERNVFIFVHTRGKKKRGTTRRNFF